MTTRSFDVNARSPRRSASHNSLFRHYARVAIAAWILCAVAPRATCATGFDLQVIKSFSSNDGAHPFSTLLQTSDGTLYGTTVTGNNSIAHDTLFKVNPDGSGFTVLHDLSTVDAGGDCNGGLILGADGMLYGAAFRAGFADNGTVFKVNRDGTGFVVLKNFDGVNTGGVLYGRLTQGRDGTLYGTAYTGGAGNLGTVYKVNPDGSGFAVLVNFYQATGGHPNGGVIQGTDGALYGTAVYGGAYGGGTLYKVNPDGTNFTVLIQFDFNGGGQGPDSQLLQGPDGMLYGTAQGGSLRGGTIFKLNPDGSNFTTLKNFESSVTGSDMSGPLSRGSDGYLYGVTLHGGAYGYGTIYRIRPDGTEFALLRHFDSTNTGGTSYAGVIQGIDGAIYGTAGYGGSGDYGTIFRVTPSANTAPTAVAGSDSTIHAGTLVRLNGGASFDDNTSSASLVYTWSFASRPAGSTAVLSGANSMTASFTADMTGTYVVQLIVTDGAGLSSAPAFVQFSSFNQAPTSVATVDATLPIIGQTLHFDGTGSTDPDGDSLTYAWSLVSAPAGSTATLGGANSARASLTPDVVGDYQIMLVVSDFLGAGKSAIVSITATTASGFAMQKTIAACAVVDQFSDDKMSKGHRTAFCNMLRQAVKDLQKDHVSAAVEKLTQAVGRTDGCALRGTVDGNGPGMDWIKDCGAQSQVYPLLDAAIHALTP